MTEKKATKPETDAPALELVVGLEGMLIGDLEILEKPATATAMIDLLDRLVTNIDIRTLPVSQLTAVSAAVRDHIKALAENPS